jgi:thioesterase domain-containing protein/acyl carrier protein
LPRLRRERPLRASVRPRTESELRVAAIWQELLGTDSVGVTDDFFASGGHSLLAARLVARVEAEFGVSISIASVFRDPTIAGLARLVTSPCPDARPSSLVPLRAAGTNTPLFLVHGLSGSVLPYLPLARQVNGDRPVFGIRARGLERDETPHRSIEAMAAEYVDAVRGQFPTGPYLLAGWSMGGVIALEMAAQLSAVGADVKLVALLDSVPTLPPSVVDSTAGGREALRKLVDPLGIDDLPDDDDTAFWSLPLEDQLELFEARLRQRTLQQPRLTTALRSLEVVRANLAAIHTHRRSSYSGSMVVIGTEVTTALIGDAALGWHSAGFDRVSVHTVSGDHDSILRHSNSVTLARLLDRLMVDAAVPSAASVV